MTVFEHKPQYKGRKTDSWQSEKRIVWEIQAGNTILVKVRSAQNEFFCAQIVL
jgi:hypothetical protein